MFTPYLHDLSRSDQGFTEMQPVGQLEKSPHFADGCSPTLGPSFTQTFSKVLLGVISWHHVEEDERGPGGIPLLFQWSGGAEKSQDSSI